MSINTPKNLIECVVLNFKRLVGNIIFTDILNSWTGRRGGGPGPGTTVSKLATEEARPY